jgi:endonuclease V-like protein UPF0215 family
VTVLKAETRVIGIDDGGTRRKRRVVVGAILRGALWLDGVITSIVDIPTDSLGKILGDMVTASRFYKELRFAILHGSILRFAGPSFLTDFNSNTNMPTIAFVRRGQDKSFGFEAKGKTDIVDFRFHASSVHCIGLTEEDAQKVLRMTSLRAGMPEPIRVAGLIASAANAPKRLNWA